jgi:hypothetical protein
MSPKKRAPKKVKRAKKAVRAKKKAARAKKPASKTKRRGAKASAGKVGRGAAAATARRKGDHLRTAAAMKDLGEWSEHTGEEHDPQSSLFEDDLPPDYGGSK